MDNAEFILRGAGVVEQISSATGIGAPGLRLLIGLLAGYPLALIYRFLLPRNYASNANIFFSILNI
jgi:hypothetical protein